MSDELLDAVCKENAALRAAVKRLNATLRWTHDTYCTADYTDRGRHAPECLIHDVEDIQMTDTERAKDSALVRWDDGQGLYYSGAEWPSGDDRMPSVVRVLLTGDMGRGQSQEFVRKDAAGSTTVDVLTALLAARARIWNIASEHMRREDWQPGERRNTLVMDIQEAVDAELSRRIKDIAGGTP